jgi:hypothetical protein
MSFPRKGFVATRGAGKTDYLRIYPVFVNSNQAYFVNAVVGLNSSGQVINVTASTVSPVLGVIQALYGDPGNDLDPPKALTFNQPTRGPYLTSGQTGFALVNTDPDQVYTVQYDATASLGMVGLNINVSAAAGGQGNTRTGISGQNVAAATAAIASERQFQIVGLAPNEMVTGRGEKAPGAGILVKLNGSQVNYGSKTGI